MKDFHINLIFVDSIIIFLNYLNSSCTKSFKSSSSQHSRCISSPRPYRLRPLPILFPSSNIPPTTIFLNQFLEKKTCRCSSPRAMSSVVLPVTIIISSRFIIHIEWPYFNQSGFLSISINITSTGMSSCQRELNWEEEGRETMTHGE